jgi:hypothetical protein
MPHLTECGEFASGLDEDREIGVRVLPGGEEGGVLLAGLGGLLLGSQDAGEAKVR